MRKAEPTGGRPKGVTCVNCDKLLQVAHVFESLFLCDACFAVADKLVRNCRRNLESTMNVYKRILVAAAMEKKLHLQHAKAEEKTTVHD